MKKLLKREHKIKKERNSQKEERSAVLLSESLKIIKNAGERNILLRLLGSVAIRVHSPQYAFLLDELKRIPNDIDFIGLKEQSKSIKELFFELKYEINQYILMISEGRRFLLNNPIKAIETEVIFDKIDYCHSFDLRNRLTLDSPTIPLADLLLSKLQIIELNKKDIVDILILLTEHNLGTHEKETINIEYISYLLSKNWGLYYTITLNLKKIYNFLSKMHNFNPQAKKISKGKIEKMLNSIESKKKSFRWKIRSIIGKKIQWYHVVDEK